MIKSATGIILLAVLAACAAPDPDPATLEALPPPEVESLTEQEQIVADTVAEQPIEQQLDNALRQSEKEQRGFLPGFASQPEEISSEGQTASQDNNELPFAEELEKQKKRIQLGLEREKRDEEPVSNVIGVEF